MAANTEHAAALSVIRGRDGRRYAAVGDIVAMLLEMAHVTDGSTQSAGEALRLVADAFIPAAGTGEIFPDAPADTPRPCTACRQPVRSYPRLGEGTIVLDSDKTPYGKWMVLRTVGGYRAVPYDHTRHGQLNVARYREHLHPAITTPGGTDG